MVVRFARSSRKHRIGRAHAVAAMGGVVPTSVTASGGDDALLFVDPDDRGVELEIVAVPIGEDLLVIHVMPTHYRRSER